jgi:hypothetical protein
MCNNHLQEVHAYHCQAISNPFLTATTTPLWTAVTRALRSPWTSSGDFASVLVGTRLATGAPALAFEMWGVVEATVSASAPADLDKGPTEFGSWRRVSEERLAVVKLEAFMADHLSR